MSFSVLCIPIDSKEISEFVAMFKFKSHSNIYRDSTIKQMKQHWGEDLAEEQSGYIDASLDVVENGKLLLPFKEIHSKELETYLKEKVGDFSLYGRFWHSSPSEYEIKVPYNIGTSCDQYWIDMSLSFDGTFNIKKATFAYDNDTSSNKYLSCWVTKYSN